MAEFIYKKVNPYSPLLLLKLSKIKIFNDPVYGFLSIPQDISFRIVEHPYFQRLRRIKQLGLTDMVYPGALHTRFHHALGALHLLYESLDTLRTKGVHINNEEAEAVSLAVLLHDVGHGPFSHALEHTLTKGINHEEISLLFMQRLNKEFPGKLELAIEIYRNRYHRKFLNQLISSQLDVDRLDYLRRDSFYTGVSEGVIGSDRIIKMMTVVNDELVIEAKGIYSIEKFLIARRLMYWQVYLHKTVVSAEKLLVKILERAKYLVQQGEKLFATPALAYFLRQDAGHEAFISNSKVLDTFARLDDNDILASVKCWTEHNDKVLRLLCSMLVDRNLYKIKISDHPFPKKEVERLGGKTLQTLEIDNNEVHNFVFSDVIENKAYSRDNIGINIAGKDGSITDISKASDLEFISTLSEPVKKYFICYPKQID